MPRPPPVTRAENIVKFGRVVPEICWRTDRQTDRQTCLSQYPASLIPYRGLSRVARHVNCSAGLLS